MKAIALITVLALSLGCAGFAGKVGSADVASEAECAGIYFSLGDVLGPCGIEGGGISLPGAAMVGGVVKAVGDAVLSLLGRAPIVITHEVTAE